MFESKNAVATIAVKDLGAARKFYEGTLGLKATDSEDSEAVTYKTGSSSLFVYRSQYAGTNRATAATWLVGDELQGIVRELKSKGVSFEHYDFPDMAREGDVHVAGNMKAAWFKDPDGNILAMISG